MEKLKVALPEAHSATAFTGPRSLACTEIVPPVGLALPAGVEEWRPKPASGTTNHFVPLWLVRHATCISALGLVVLYRWGGEWE